MSHSVRKTAAGVAALAALGLGGSALANAATSSNGTTHTGSSAQAPPRMPAPGTATHEDAEKAVTGDAATKAQAAAAKSVGSGTAGPVTTDYFGNGYEVVVTKSDGTKVEVHLDGSFNVMQRRPGGRGAPPGLHGAAPGLRGAPPGLHGAAPGLRGAPPRGQRAPGGAGAPPAMYQ